jgi:hypothetical protein
MGWEAAAAAWRLQRDRVAPLGSRSLLETLPRLRGRCHRAATHHKECHLGRGVPPRRHDCAAAQRGWPTRREPRPPHARHHRWRRVPWPAATLLDGETFSIPPLPPTHPQPPHPPRPCFAPPCPARAPLPPCPLRPPCDGAQPTAPASSRYSSSVQACLCSARSLSTRWTRYPLTPPRPARPAVRHRPPPACRLRPPACCIQIFALVFSLLALTLALIFAPSLSPSPLALSRRSSPCTSTPPSAC